MITLEEMKDDYDWQQAFFFGNNVNAVLGDDSCPSDTFTLDDVEKLLAADPGENDGAYWVAIVVLKDGRFAYIRAGCDYTGWDCQSWGEAFVSGSFTRLWQYGVDEFEKTRLISEIGEEL